MRPGAVVAILLGVLAVVAAAAFYLWSSLDGVEIGWRGYLAIALGVGFSLLVGGGLMALMFISARRGYDEGGGRVEDPASSDRERRNRE
jgi:hypothetical protein